MLYSSVNRKPIITYPKHKVTVKVNIVEDITVIEFLLDCTVCQALQSACSP
jgi:hypothetical protein